MRRSVAVSLLILLPAWASAQDDAVRLTAEELRAFLPGTKVVHHNKAGSLRRWVNHPSGSFVASSDNKKFGNALGTQAASAPGKWNVTDDGKYCIAIEWGRVSENWCAFILKTASNEYYLNAVDADRKIEFVK